MVKISTSAPSPLSPTLWPADAFVWWRSLLFAAALVVMLFVGGIVFAVLWIRLIGPISAKNPSTAFLLVDQTVAYIAGFAVLAFLPALARRSWRELGLRAPTATEVGWGLAGAAAMFIVSQLIGSIEEHVFHLKVQETAVDLLKSVRGPTLVLFAFLACIVAPVVEELSFRGFALNALLRYLPPVTAGVVSALLFGLVHGSWTALAPLAGAGGVLAVVYYRTGALSASMIAHAGFNGIAVLGYILFKIA